MPVNRPAAPAVPAAPVSPLGFRACVGAREEKQRRIDHRRGCFSGAGCGCGSRKLLHLEPFKDNDHDGRDESWNTTTAPAPREITRYWLELEPAREGAQPIASRGIGANCVRSSRSSSTLSSVNPGMSTFLVREKTTNQRRF